MPTSSSLSQAFNKLTWKDFNPPEGSFITQLVGPCLCTISNSPCHFNNLLSDSGNRKRLFCPGINARTLTHLSSYLSFCWYHACPKVSCTNCDIIDIRAQVWDFISNINSRTCSVWIFKGFLALFI